MKVWEGKQVIGFLLTWRLLRPQLQQQTTDKYHRFQVVTVTSKILFIFQLIGTVVKVRSESEYDWIKQGFFDLYCW